MKSLEKAYMGPARMPTTITGVERGKIHHDAVYIEKPKVEWGKISPWMQDAIRWSAAQGHPTVWMDALGNIVDNPYINRKTVKPDGGIFS